MYPAVVEAEHYYQSLCHFLRTPHPFPTFPSLQGHSIPNFVFIIPQLLVTYLQNPKQRVKFCLLVDWLYIVSSCLYSVTCCFHSMWRFFACTHVDARALSY